MDFLPMPHAVTYGSGVFALHFDTAILLTDAEPGALLYAQMLRDEVRRATGYALPILRGAPRPGDVVLRQDPSLPADSYTITVTPEVCEVAGESDEALLNGVTTLMQWVRRHGARLPAIHVEDRPDLKCRGYYLDCSRGRVPTLATLKRQADLLCRYKINEWQLYVEHTYLFRDLSEAWRGDTPLTAEEIMELDAYCRARHIELVPSLSTFGHMFTILSTKTCCELCELEDSEKKPFTYSWWGPHHTLRTDDPRALEFIKGMITEYAALFTSRKFNICCDETFDLGKGRSKALAEERGKHTLYMDHVSSLCSFLLAQGITPQFWGDIVWREPESVARIPKGTICLNWGYDADQREDEVRTLGQAGVPQYVCPGVSTWNHWLPMLRDSFSNIRAMCAHGRKYGAVGLLNTDWGDYGHVCAPELSIPGILYGAAFAWNADPCDFDEVNRAISFLVYGDREGRFMEAFTALTARECFWWGFAVDWIEAKDPARRHEIFAKLRHVQSIPEANAELSAALARLDEAAHLVDVDQRGVVESLALGARGVRLWNEVAQHIAATYEGQNVPHRDPVALAADLEQWYNRCMEAWRAVSKEGTLRHTLKVVCDYADMLRSREHEA